jgi:hypothetical protein
LSRRFSRGRRVQVSSSWCPARPIDSVKPGTIESGFVDDPHLSNPPSIMETR